MFCNNSIAVGARVTLKRAACSPAEPCHQAAGAASAHGRALPLWPGRRGCLGSAPPSSQMLSCGPADHECVFVAPSAWMERELGTRRGHRLQEAPQGALVHPHPAEHLGDFLVVRCARSRPLPGQQLVTASEPQFTCLLVLLFIVKEKSVYVFSKKYTLRTHSEPRACHAPGAWPKEQEGPLAPARRRQKLRGGPGGEQARPRGRQRVHTVRQGHEVTRWREGAGSGGRGAAETVGPGHLCAGASERPGRGAADAKPHAENQLGALRTVRSQDEAWAAVGATRAGARRTWEGVGVTRRAMEMAARPLHLAGLFQATAAPGQAPRTRPPPASPRVARSWVVLLFPGHPHGLWDGFQPSAT